MRRAMQVAPLLRASEVRALRELIKAAPAGFRYPGHGTLAPKPVGLSPIRQAEIAAEAEMREGVGRRMAIELDRQAGERGEAAAKTAPISKVPTAGFPAADRAGRCAIERAPEGTIGSAGVGSCEPENVRSPRTVSEPARIDLKAAPSAMDARWRDKIAPPVALPRAIIAPEDCATARADPCTRCEGRWPILRLHPIISACIETPCPMKAMLPKAKQR